MSSAEIMAPPGHVIGRNGQIVELDLVFGPNPQRGTYELRRCDACWQDRLCRYYRVAGGLWLCDGPNHCYRRRWIIRLRAEREETLR